MFPSAAMVAHSCRPNVLIRYFIIHFLCAYRASYEGARIVMRACVGLASGDVLYASYGPHAARLPTAARQQRLKEQYFFTCNCSGCTVQTPADEARGLLCPCGGIVPSLETACRKCKGNLSKEQSDDISQRLGRVALLKRQAAGQTGADAVSTMQACVGMLARTVHPASKILGVRYDYNVQLR